MSQPERLDLGALARELPDHQPSDRRREAIRTSILLEAEAAPPPPRRRRWLAPAAVALAAAAAVVLYLALPSGDDALPAPAHRAAVQAPDGARFVHNTRPSSAGGTDEVVDLEAGRVTVAVEPLATDESFRVVTRDAEIATRGAAFEVEADGSELREIRVHAGHVELRREGRTVILAAGEVWTPVVETRELELPDPEPEPAAAAEPTPVDGDEPPPVAAPPPPARAAAPPARATPPPAAPPAVAVEPPPAPPVAPAPAAAPTPIERAFDGAWTDLRAGKFASAAAGFARAIAADPDHALAEDARYWRAIALARGRDRRAAAAMKAFLRRHPQSARAGEVSVMLGWIELRAGRRDRAADRFRRGLDDPRADVRASARAGMDALAR
jgi:TolA-binding protein